MAGDPILIRNDTTMVVKYGVWWRYISKADGLLRPGELRSYEDNDSNAVFNVAFYYLGDPLIGQSIDTPLGYTVALKAFDGGFGIARFKPAAASPALSKEDEMMRIALSHGHYE